MSDNISVNRARKEILSQTQETLSQFSQEDDDFFTQMLDSDDEYWKIDWVDLNEEVFNLKQSEMENEKERQERERNQSLNGNSSDAIEDLSPEEVQAFIADAWTDDEVPFLDQETMAKLPGPPAQDPSTSASFDVLKPEVLEVITQNLTKGTREKYAKYWKLYESYCRECGIPEKSEVSVCYFIHEMLNRKIFGVGSVWSVYSCLNWTYSTKYRENLNKYRQLRALLTGLTKHYIPKKSGVISAEKIKELLTKKLRMDDPFELMTIVTVALAYFGLLRKSEILTLEYQDVHLDKKNRLIEVFYDHPSKTRPIGFKYTIPSWLFDAFERYTEQIKDKKPSGRFLKNAVKAKYGKIVRKTNMGKGRIDIMLRRIEILLGLEPKVLTAHCFRRSGATALADSGASVINIKRAGRWRSLTTVDPVG